MAFFSGITTGVQKKALPVIADCNTCGAWKTCSHGKQSFTGNPTKTVIVVPGIGVDAPDGIKHTVYKRLERLLGRLGKHRSDYTILSATACPDANDEAWRHCMPILADQIRRINPVTVIPFGTKPISSVITTIWNNAAETQDRFMGYRIPSQAWNAWVCPVGTISPQKGMIEVSEMWAYRHMKAALALTERPWKTKQDYGSLVESLYTEEHIIKALGEIPPNAWSAFDYEANGLKLEAPGMKIVSAAVAWVADNEIRCISFPMLPGVRDAWIKYLQSPGKKIAANMKYEIRASWAQYRVRVNTLVWDTVIAAHIDNNAKTTTGLKFQSLVKLGLPYYAHDVDELLGSDGPSVPNKIHLIPMGSLLRYGGIDAVAELILGSVQLVEAELISKHIVPLKYIPGR